MNVAIVAGGHNNHLFLEEIINNQSFDMIIGVDGGVNYLYQSQIFPNIILGDFDSIDNKAKVFFEGKNIKSIEFPPEKDMTDTHIAIEYAIEKGAKEIVLLSATGTRMDHTLANIFLIEKYMTKVKINILNENNNIQLIRDKQSVALQLNHYKYISLLPFSDRVEGITSKGLKYELQDAILTRMDSLGVSNEFEKRLCSISIKKGLLAIIQSRD